MSEANYLVELREAAPQAPERLHGLVTSMRPRSRRPINWRAGLIVAVGALAAVSVGAAVIGGMRGLQRQAHPAGGESTRLSLAPMPMRRAASIPQHGSTRDFAPQLTAKSRLQSQDVSMSLRVKDLSSATQSAVRTTRRLGGFVATADYATGAENGNSRLELRLPVVNLQRAIARFTGLGMILSQHISVADLQTGLDRLDARIATARTAGHKKRVTRLERRRAALVREGTYAKVSLQLSTTKPPAKNVVPSRFDRFRDNAGDILGKEAIGVLYFLVIAGPFIFLAALALLGERARRRRADHRLLEETG